MTRTSDPTAHATRPAPGLGSAVRHGPAGPLPGRLRDQPVHGSGDASPTRAAAMAQWRAPGRHPRDGSAHGSTSSSSGADAPDMVYAMNLGLALTDAGRTGSRCPTCATRSAARRPRRARAWFAEAGFAPTFVGRDGVGAHLEAGDAFPFAGELVVGYGPRTEEQALKHLATDFDIAVRGVRITHPGCTTSTWPSARSTPRRPWSVRLPSTRERPGAARPGARPDRAQRAGGAHVLRQLGRRRPHRRDAGLPDRVRRELEDAGLHGGDRRRVRVPQGRRVDPLPDEPARHHGSGRDLRQVRGRSRSRYPR